VKQDENERALAMDQLEKVGMAPGQRDGCVIS
jgi:hypothetical protein